MATKIFVGSLPPGTKPEELRHLFEDYGVVVECDVMNRCGFVHMETKEMANTAITALHASEFKGQMIVVELGRPKDRKANADNGRDGNIRSRGTARGGGGRNSGPGNRGGRDSDIIDGGNNRQNFGNNSGRGAPKNKFNQGSGSLRNDHFKPQRNMPYQRRNDGPGRNSSDASGMFGGNQRGNFNSGNSNGSRGFGRGGGDGGQHNFHNWDKQTLDGNSQFGGLSNFNGNEGYGNNFGSNSGGNLSGGFGGNKGIGGQGQDRRGFALPMGGRGGSGGGQRFSNGNPAFAGSNPVGAFGGSGMQNNVGLPNNSTEGLFSRRNNGSNGHGNNMPPRGGFHGGYGNDQGGGNANSGGRGGFRRGDGGGGGNNERFSAPNNYNSNFPPLRAQGFGGRGGSPRGGWGGGNQRNGPRQNQMPYQRF